MIALITIQMKLIIKDLETVLSFYIIYYHGILTTTHPIFADISSKTKGAGIMFFSLSNQTLPIIHNIFTRIHTNVGSE